MRRSTHGAWVIASLFLLSSLEASSVTPSSSDRSDAINKHTLIQTSSGMPAEQREMLGMRMFMRDMLRSTASLTEMKLSASDAALLSSLISTETAFQASVVEDSSRAMETICTWGEAADAGVLAAAVTAIDEAESNKRTTRYGAFLRSLSEDGRAKILAVLLDITSAATSSKVNLASLATERPDIVKQGILQKCAGRSTGQPSGSVQSADQRVHSKGTER
jgi:hypothetical protein